MKKLLWVVIGSVMFFGGWIMKDKQFMLRKVPPEFGRALMALGFIIFAILIIYTLLKVVHINNKKNGKENSK